MKTRRILQVCLICLGIAGGAAVASVFVSSLSITDAARDMSGVEIDARDLASIRSGELKVFEVFGAPLFVLRPSSAQKQLLSQFDAHVWLREWSGYDHEKDLFLYWGVSTRFGCKLRHEPPSDSQLGLGVGRQWLGGYFDPCHDSSYDYAGRSIKTWEYTRTGFAAEVPSLHSPRYRFRYDGTLIIYPGNS